MRVLPWLLCVLSAISCAATEATVEIGGAAYRIKHWTTEEGLPQNRIGCLKQTIDGYLWIGTWAGLVRFDGVHFTPFNKSNTPELVNDAINTFAQDAGGTLWIGTHDGLVSYRGYRFQRFTMADGLPDRNFVQSVNSRSRGLWFQAGHSVVRLDDHEKFSDTRLLDLTRANHILSMRERDDRSLDIITSRAWLTLSPNTRELRTNYAAAARDDDWAAAWSAYDGSLWVGTGLGLQCLEDGGLRSFPRNGLGRGVVDFVHEDGGSNLWVNVRKDGLYRWDHAGWEWVDLGEGLGRSSIVCMEEDLEGNLWVGTDRGLIHLQKQPARAYTTRDGLADDNVLSVCEDTEGTIWAGTEHGLSCIRERGVSGLSTNEPIPEVRDLAVWPRREGGVWYGKAGQGIFVCQGTKFSRVLVAINDASGPLSALYGDRSGRLWVGTQRGALAFQEGQFDNPCEILKSPCDVRCIYEDRKGAFWFGTMKQGLLRQRDGKIASFTERDGLSNNSVWSIVEDSDGTLWIGTDNGLTRYRNGKF
jgi:ligand-binding sensor domain-containing protein